VTLHNVLATCLRSIIYFYGNLKSRNDSDKSLCTSLRLYSPCRPCPLFQFLIYKQSVGLLGRGVSLSQGRFLHTEHKHRINAYRHPGLEWNSTHNPSVRASKDSSCLKVRPHYSCLYTLRVNIRILTRRNLASNWSSVDEDLRAQIKARRDSRRAQAWRARARVMWTHL
jgi:hypothetical protein